MTIYTIRANFTIALGSTVYQGGDQIDLSNEQFELHKHKLQGVDTTVLPIVFSLKSSTSSEISFDDSTANIVDGTTTANLQSAIATLDSRLDAIEGNAGNNSGKTVLDGDTTFYVDAAGDDANTGEQNSPFATIGRALGFVDRDLDLGGYQLTIQIAPGDYTPEGLLHLPVITGAKAETCGVAPVILPPNSQVRIVGAGESTVVAGFELDHHAYYSVENLKLSANVNNSIVATRSGVIELKDLYFTSASNLYSAIDAIDNGIIYLNNDLYFYGLWHSLFKTSSGGQIKIATGQPNNLYVSQSIDPDYLLSADANGFINLFESVFYIGFDEELI